MIRLKKVANNVSPNMHKEVERHITDKNGNRWRIQHSEYVFLLAKRLISALPIVPTNERVYELAQDITIGLFDDISSIEEAESEKYWDLWKDRTVEILKSKHILI